MIKLSNSKMCPISNIYCLFFFLWWTTSKLSFFSSYAIFLTGSASYFYVKNQDSILETIFKVFVAMKKNPDLEWNVNWLRKQFHIKISFLKDIKMKNGGCRKTKLTLTSSTIYENPGEGMGCFFSKPLGRGVLDDVENFKGGTPFMCFIAF